MTNNAKIAAVVLAAGGSSRMGEPKQLLPWKSTTLLNHCLHEVMQANIHQTVVVLGAYHEKIKPTIIPSHIKCLINKNWEKGMGSSIALAVQHIKHKDIDGLLVVLADQPFVNSSFLNKFLKKFIPNKEQIIATNYNDNVGVPVIFDKQYFEELTALNDSKGAKQLILKFAQNVMKITPDFNHQDIDTPEVYRQLSALKK